jgi:hypothetical protein
VLDFLTGLAFAFAGWGAFRLLAAGRRQLRGEPPAARRAGLGTAGACAALTGVLALHGIPGLAAAAAAAGAGVCAILGGLSGKPVPAAWFTAALLLASVALLLAC